MIEQRKFIYLTLSIFLVMSFFVFRFVYSQAENQSLTSDQSIANISITPTDHPVNKNPLIKSCAERGKTRVENSYILLLKPRPNINEAECDQLEDWEERGRCVSEYGRAIEENYQREIVEYLTGNAIKHNNYWTNNSIYINDIDEDELMLIYDLFEERIDSVTESCFLNLGPHEDSQSDM